MSKTKNVRKKNKIIILIALIIFFFILTGGVVVWFMADTSVPRQAATLVVAKDSITVIRNNQVVEIKDKKIQIYAGDRIRTDVEGIGYLVFPDNSSISLDNNSEVEVKALADQATTYDTEVAQIFGRTWSRVEKLFGKQAKYEVQTRNALAAVRGTQLMCNTSSDITDCNVIEHSVVFTILDTKNPNKTVNVDENNSINIATGGQYKMQEHAFVPSTDWEIYTDCMNKSARKLLSSEDKYKINFIIEHIDELGCGDNLVSVPSTPTPIITPNTIIPTKSITKTPVVTRVLPTTGFIGPVPVMQRVSMSIYYNPAIIAALVPAGLRCVWTGQNATSYDVSVGTSINAADKVAVHNTTALTEIFATSTYSFQSGVTYYCNVKALGPGGQSTILSSVGIVYP